MSDKFSEYACQDCGWEPDFDSTYEVNGKKYPRYEDKQFNMGAAINFGGNPYDWEEIHCCPDCEKEFGFSNSNY